MKPTRPELIRFFAWMSIVSFVLHGIWEMSQMAAYKDLARRPLLETIARCTPATFGDVVLTLWIYALGALAAHSLDWGLHPRWNVYVTVALLGAIHAIWIEQAALAAGRWSYTDTMPIIPRLGVGLWPLLQLMVITPLVVWLSSRCAIHRKHSVRQHSASASR